MVRFDGYTATTLAAKHHELVGLFGAGMQFEEKPGYHQFGERIVVKDESGDHIGAVLWGGNHGDRTMIEVKGERSPEVVERLRSAFPHRCTRMDSAADFDAPGSFERLLAVCTDVKKRHRLKGRKEGDWDDFPELGRTLYIGSPKSTCMLRLYEKGKQAEYRHLDRRDWCRAENQVRPAKEAKDEFSKVSALDAWGASVWSRELAGQILADHVDPHPAGTIWKRSERDQALMWACRQYGTHLVSLKEDLGTWEAVGLTLNEMIQEAGREARRFRGH